MMTPLTAEVWQRNVGKSRVERMQVPAGLAILGGFAQLAKYPFATRLGQYIRAVLQHPIGLDDDDLALIELGLHAGTQHTQGKGIAAAAGPILGGTGLRHHASSPTGSCSTQLLICALGTPAARKSWCSAWTKASGPAR